MPINYFWWCSHWASSFLGYISPESKKKPHVFFPIMPAKQEKCFVIWVLQVAKARRQKKIQYIFGEKQPKLARNKFRTWISSFSPSCFVWRCATFGTPQKAAGENLENIPCSPSVAALRPDVHFSGVLGIQPWPTSPPVSCDQTSNAKKLKDCLFVFINDTPPPRIH